MKVSYWIVAIAVTCVIAYAVGYVKGQQSTVTTSEIVEPTDISMTAGSPVNSQTFTFQGGMFRAPHDALRPQFF